MNTVNSLPDALDSDKLPLNTILYGPPGTGKTYATARRCVEICDGKADRSEEDIRCRYDELFKEGRVEFITFHQSYGYEEFVEGLRPDTSPVTDDGNPNVGFRLEPTDGALKRIAERARKTPEPTDKPFDLGECQIFKMGLGNPYIGSEREEIFGECINNGYILLNRGGDVDWSGSDYEDYEKIIERWREIDSEATGHNINVQSINQFRNNMKIGDFIIVPSGQKQFCAVGEVTGDYQFIERDDGAFPHRRPVRWRWHDDKGLPISDIYNSTFTPKPIYSLLQEKIQFERLRLYIRPDKDSGSRSPYVLVIDEINRANVSKVLGELVTLLEEDKREGRPNEVSVTLPYSGERFTLPANLYILGTMNTADRSIALLDTALRRRFEFEELPPVPGVLKKVDGIDLPAVLGAINERLEYLIDRDHLIGHAWLMGAESREAVDRVMRHKIIPLIAEYFHDDWKKVRAVLGGGDDFVREEPLARPPGLDDDTDEKRSRWTVRDSFEDDAYDRLVSGKSPDEESEG